VALVWAGVLTGCAPKYDDLKVFLQAHDHDVAATKYRIEPPDIIALSSPTSSEVNGEVQRVRSDGKISLKLLGEVKVSGLTPREVAAKMETLLAEYYVSPTVNVRVLAYESKNVYTFGQVGARGPHPFTGRDTVLDILARAGLNSIAWGAQVKVIRPSPTPEERHEVVVDVDKMMKSGDLQKNFLLQEGDIVYVPPTPLGQLGLWIHEVLFPISPLASLYQVPPRFKATTDYYQGNYDNDDDDDDFKRRMLLLLR
jgi:polysaccharide export outer membrane protein